MSRENVELVLGAMEAINRRDLEAALESFHADVQFYDTGTTRATVGRTAVRKMWQEWLDSFAEYHEVPEDVLDLGDQVVVVVHSVGRGHVSGVTVDERHGEVHEFRHGLAIKVTIYPTPEAALEAVGLGE